MAGDIVKKAYTDRPFPERDPEDERKRLVETDFGSVRMVNSIFWGGRKRMGKGFRVLDAGCGTGDVVIQLAEELRGTGAEIVALDFSEASIAIARRRAEVRGLDGIRFVADSLLNIPRLGLGEFDYIVSTGVLPHLESPDEGLRVLRGCLKPEGGMGIVVYGRYGRLPVQVMQDIAGVIERNEPDEGKRDGMMDQVGSALPPFNWIRLLGDYREVKYDALLSSRTRSYTVPEAYSLVEGAGLRLLRFKDPTVYDPGFYMRPEPEWARRLPRREREALSEMMNSRMLRHSFFATHASYEPPSVDPFDESIVPAYRGKKPEIADMAAGATATLSMPGDMYRRDLRVDRRHASILSRINGERSLGEILKAAAGMNSLSSEQAMAVWKEIYEATRGTDLIVLNLPPEK